MNQAKYRFAKGLVTVMPDSEVTLKQCTSDETPGGEQGLTQYLNDMAGGFRISDDLLTLTITPDSKCIQTIVLVGKKAMHISSLGVDESRH